MYTPPYESSRVSLAIVEDPHASVQQSCAIIFSDECMTGCILHCETACRQLHELKEKSSLGDNLVVYQRVAPSNGKNQYECFEWSICVRWGQIVNRCSAFHNPSLQNVSLWACIYTACRTCEGEHLLRELHISQAFRSPKHLK